MGPNNPNTILEATNDLTYFSPELGREVTSGSLTWGDGESGPLSFTLNVKARNGWEVAKTFVVTIYTIEGFPATSGNGEAPPTAANVSLTVRSVIRLLS